MSKLSTFIHLPGPQKRAILRVLPATAAIEIGLPMLSLPRLARLLGVRLLVDREYEHAPVAEIGLSDEERLEVRAAHLLFKNRSEYGQCFGLRSSSDDALAGETPSLGSES